MKMLRPLRKNTQSLLEAKVRIVARPEFFYGACVRAHVSLFVYDEIASCMVTNDREDKKRAVYGCLACGGMYEFGLILGRNYKLRIFPVQWEELAEEERVTVRMLRRKE